jgi:hypothetical protein
MSQFEFGLGNELAPKLSVNFSTRWTNDSTALLTITTLANFNLSFTNTFVRVLGPISDPVFGPIPGLASVRLTGDFGSFAERGAPIVEALHLSARSDGALRFVDIEAVLADTTTAALPFAGICYNQNFPDRSCEGLVPVLELTSASEPTIVLRAPLLAIKSQSAQCLNASVANATAGDVRVAFRASLRVSSGAAVEGLYLVTSLDASDASGNNLTLRAGELAALGACGAARIDTAVTVAPLGAVARRDAPVLRQILVNVAPKTSFTRAQIDIVVDFATNFSASPEGLDCLPHRFELLLRSIREETRVATFGLADITDSSSATNVSLGARALSLCISLARPLDAPVSLLLAAHARPPAQPTSSPPPSASPLSLPRPTRGPYRVSLSTTRCVSSPCVLAPPLSASSHTRHSQGFQPHLAGARGIGQCLRRRAVAAPRVRGAGAAADALCLWRGGRGAL